MQPKLNESKNEHELDFESLNHAVNQIDLSEPDGEIEYRDHLYYFLFVDDDSYMDTPGRWRVSTSGHYDIEIEVKESLNDLEKRRTILHETIEADLNQFQQMNMQSSHTIAKEYDQQYGGT